LRRSWLKVRPKLRLANDKC